MTQTIINHEFLSIPEVAKLRGVRTATAYNWLNLGLASTKDRWGRILVKKKDALAFTTRPGRRSKLTKNDVKRAKKMRRDGKTLDEIGREMGLSGSAIWYVIRR